MAISAAVSSEQSTAATIPACFSDQAGPLLPSTTAAWCLHVVRFQMDPQQGGEAMQEPEEAVGLLVLRAEANHLRLRGAATAQR
jgi:hypothetical protein